MDPKQLSQLDPKLREAYERVMGTNVNQPQAEASAQQPQQPSQPEPPATPEATAPVTVPVELKVSAETPQPYSPQASPPPVVAAQPQSIGSTMAFNAHKQAGKGSGKSVLSSVAIGLGVVIFLVLYTVIWIKVFNLSLPFLS